MHFLLDSVPSVVYSFLKTVFVPNLNDKPFLHLLFSSLSDVFTHLTNYSINKNSSTYLPNEDSEMRQGHKWTLTSLWAYLAEQGIDSRPVLDNIKDLVS